MTDGQLDKNERWVQERMNSFLEFLETLNDMPVYSIEDENLGRLHHNLRKLAFKMRKTIIWRHYRVGRVTLKSVGNDFGIGEQRVGQIVRDCDWRIKQWLYTAVQIIPSANLPSDIRYLLQDYYLSRHHKTCDAYSDEERTQMQNFLNRFMIEKPILLIRALEDCGYSRKSPASKVMSAIQHYEELVERLEERCSTL